MKQPNETDPQLARLEKRLLEAFDDLWDDFVDPAEAYDDPDGTLWREIGSAGHNGAAGLPFTNEGQLREIRARCRALAVSNEFAINGHESLVRKPPSRP